MNCVVTAGPTYEPLDEVRRLTNFSTGRLGTELANFLVGRGHEVTLLVGQQATHGGERRAQSVQTFTTVTDLRERLRALSGSDIGAVFHAAAVSDFTFGKVWHCTDNGELTQIKSAKISTRQGPLLAELLPTPKIISELREWHPRARLIGWNYEVEGDRAGVIALAERQISECRTDACVVNGRAYGEGFGLLTARGKNTHFANGLELFTALEKFVQTG